MGISGFLLDLIGPALTGLSVDWFLGFGPSVEGAFFFFSFFFVFRSSMGRHSPPFNRGVTSLHRQSERSTADPLTKQRRVGSAMISISIPIDVFL